MTVIKIAEKKKIDKKEKVAVKKTVSKANVGVKPQKLAAEKYPASEIAKNLNIPDFAFLVMKQETGIQDSTFLSISEFQNKYKMVVGR